MDFAQFKALLKQEYEWLCAALELTPVTLEVIASPDSGWPRYGGDPRRIEIAVSDNDLSVVHAATATQNGPPTWDEKSYEGYHYWQEWRSSLWHEVVHQVQDQRGFGWNPMDGKNGHAHGWQTAVEWVADRLGGDPRKLYVLLGSHDT